MTIVQCVNEKGLRHLANWIKATANEDHRHIDPQNLDAWANEAEESMGNGNPPMVEMQAPATLSGVPETFTIPADGIYEQDDLSPAVRSSLARITRACAIGETAQGHDLFDIPELHKVADIPVERLHATYDYSMAVRYLAKLIPADAAALADETGVEIEES